MLRLTLVGGHSRSECSRNAEREPKPTARTMFNKKKKEKQTIKRNACILSILGILKWIPEPTLAHNSSCVHFRLKIAHSIHLVEVRRTNISFEIGSGSAFDVMCIESIRQTCGYHSFQFGFLSGRLSYRPVLLLPIGSLFDYKSHLLTHFMELF